MDLGSKRIFGLAHLYVQYEHYRDFLKARKKEGYFITMDNSAAEKALVTEDILIEVVRDLMPHEVISPDHLFDKDNTIKSLNSFVKRMKQEELYGKVEIFAVPQGGTKEEWLDCYNYMLIHPDVHTIGMSKLGIPHAFLGQAKDDQGIMEARHECVDLLLQADLIKKPLHFLGMGNPLEMKKYVALNNPLFRSTDSCNSVWSAMCGISWEHGDYRRIKTPHNYFEQKMSEANIELAISNIEFFHEIFHPENQSINK
jgi:hypothetical protein